MLGVGCTLSVFAGGKDALTKDTDQLIGFIDQRFQSFWLGKKRNSLNQAQPSPCLAHFLHADLHFMNKIIRRLSILSLAMVRIRRCSGAQQLMSNMALRLPSFHFCREPNNPCRKLQQSLLQIKFSAALRVRLICHIHQARKLVISIWEFDVGC
jgi:hypothetical protein